MYNTSVYIEAFDIKAFKNHQQLLNPWVAIQYPNILQNSSKSFHQKLSRKLKDIPWITLGIFVPILSAKQCTSPAGPRRVSGPAAIGFDTHWWLSCKWSRWVPTFGAQLVPWKSNKKRHDPVGWRVGLHFFGQSRPFHTPLYYNTSTSYPWFFRAPWPWVQTWHMNKITKESKGMALTPNLAHEQDH